MTTIGSVTEEVRNRYGKTSSADHIPIYGVDRTTGLTPEAKYASRNLTKYKILDPGMFTYNPMRLNIGSIGFCDRNRDVGLVSSDYIVFKCREDKVIPEFIDLMTRTKTWQAWVDSAGVGSVRTRIYYRELAEMPILLPPVDEQEDICSVLESIDRSIAANSQVMEETKRIVQAIFRSWFVDFDPVHAKAGGRAPFGMDDETAALFPDSFEDSELGEIPRGWNVRPMEEVIELAYGKALKEADRMPGDIPVYGSNGRVGWHNRSLFDGPGIIVGRKGNPGTVTWSQTPFFCIDTTYYVVPLDVVRSLYYLFYALRAQDLQSLSADSAVPGLSRRIAYMNKMLVPPSQVIQQFDMAVRPFYDLMFANEAQSRTLAHIHDVLLPRLISGEMRIPEGSGGNVTETEASE